MTESMTSVCEALEIIPSVSSQCEDINQQLLKFQVCASLKE